jgi:N-acetyl-gamma-glutamyl-phosphate reductase
LSARAVVLGASGFAGAELLRLLENHPSLSVVAAAASSSVGEAVTARMPTLGSLAGMRFVAVSEALGTECDIVFSSLPHSASMDLFGAGTAFKIVDLGGDHRLRDPVSYQRWFGRAHAHPERLDEWVYGMTEFKRADIAKAERVANPGCYPTAALLALLPLLRDGVIEPAGIHIDAKSGISGAGRAGGEGFDYASINENLSPYSVTGHKHIAEIEQELAEVAETEVRVSFVPHLAPMTRGLLASCVATLADSSKDPAAVLASAYRDEPFVRLAEGGLPHTKRLTGTNHAEVAAKVDERTGRVLAFAAIDNLGKGAAGQAIQNANLMLGFPETDGLGVHPCLP